MRHLQQIQSQLTTYPVPSLDPNLVAVKFLSLCSARANLRHGTVFFRYYLRDRSPNIIAQNALLSALARHSRWAALLRLFNQQLSDESLPRPDEFTFTSVLKACAAIPSTDDGLKLHCLVAKYGCDPNVFVKNSLLHFYFKLGEVEIARKLFDEMPLRDVVSWNTLVTGYCLSGRVGDARAVFDGMAERSLVTWAAMVTGYARAGELDEARRLFEEMPERNAVCWNAMISGYVRNERYGDAVALFRRMQNEIESNEVTLVSVLCACAHLGDSNLGAWIDGFIRRTGMDLGLVLGNALADMYAKCGLMTEAKRVFDMMSERDVISWSVLISGSAMNGHANEAFECFDAMLHGGTAPNEVTFMGLLTACTHVGLVEKGLEYFYSMERVYKIAPKVEHYGCAVDLLSRAGRLDEAEEMISSMPVEPNVIVWGALLGGCRTHRDHERGERVVRRILAIEPDHSGGHVYLANSYASVGRVDEALEWRSRMREKRPGLAG